MARLLTCGFEAGAPAAETSDLGGISFYAAGTAQSTAPSGMAYSSAQVRSGAGALLVSGGASSNASNYLLAAQAYSWSSTTILYTRVAFYAQTLPSSGDFYVVMIMDSLNTTSGHGLQLVLDASGIIAQNFSNNATQFTGPAPSTGVWHVLEASYVPNTGATVIRVDGQVVASGSVEAMQSQDLGTLYASVPTGTCTVYLDDLAANDNTGSSQNSWCGSGRVVMLRPVSDYGRAGFTAGGSATTNLWNAVDNVPPVGVALGSASATSQIEDVSLNTTDYYAATMQTYSVAGVPGGAPIVCLEAIASVGDSSGSTLNAGLSVLSNPAVTEVVTATPTPAAGTWPTGWGEINTGYVYAPAVSLSAAPVVNIRHATALSADDLQCCQMTLLVEYGQATPNPPMILSQAVQRPTGR